METIGSLIDKLSIINLRMYHLEENVNKHHEDSIKKDYQSKLKVIKYQREDLIKELNQLYKEVITGKRKVKVYRQFRMYGKK